MQPNTSMELTPKVSIVIPVYNGSNYMREAIDSALNQTYQPVEVIVVNDGSRDDGKSEQVALSYGNRIRYIPKENGGVATALNRGLQEMTGDYFTWLSHDDVLSLDKTQKQIELLQREKNPDLIVYSDFEVIDGQSRVIANFKYKEKPVTGKEPIGFKYALLPYNPVFFCTMLVPKNCFDDLGGFDVHLRTTQDYEMCLRLAGKYRFIYMPDKTAMNRVHPEQVTFTNQKQVEETDQLMVRMLDLLQQDNDNHPHRELLKAYFLGVAYNLKTREMYQGANLAYRVASQLPSHDIFRETLLRVGYQGYNKHINPLYWYRWLRKKYRNRT